MIGLWVEWARLHVGPVHARSAPHMATTDTDRVSHQAPAGVNEFQKVGATLTRNLFGGCMKHVGSRNAPAKCPSENRGSLAQW